MTAKPMSEEEIEDLRKWAECWIDPGPEARQALSLLATIDALRAERDAARKQVNFSANEAAAEEIRYLNKERMAERDRADAADALLKSTEPYFQHQKGCPSWKDATDPASDYCDCGFKATIARIDHHLGRGEVACSFCGAADCPGIANPKYHKAHGVEAAELCDNCGAPKPSTDDDCFLCGKGFKVGGDKEDRGRGEGVGKVAEVRTEAQIIADLLIEAEQDGRYPTIHYGPTDAGLESNWWVELVNPVENLGSFSTAEIALDEYRIRKAAKAAKTEQERGGGI